MIRYLLKNHPIAICVVLFAIVMLLVRFGAAPYIVTHYGLPGTLITLAGIYLLGFVMDKR